LASRALCAEVPSLRGRINDYAQLLSADAARTLENQLSQFEKETGHQVAVLTVPTLDGEDIEGFSIRVAESWKIGQKGFDNGVILVVAPKERQLRLEVGYGLEGILPDAIASRIIREIIVPRFRDNDYAGGITSGIDAVLKVIRGEPLPESARQKQRGTNPWAALIFPVVLFLLFLAGALFRRRGPGAWMTHGRRGGPFGWGGGFGGGGYRGGFGGGGGGGFGGGGFSGGGGGFGGGGASGRW
ncbi:MAG: TPM domain-containing protein, partial [Candidatus Binatia bacterium]